MKPSKPSKKHRGLRARLILLLFCLLALADSRWRLVVTCYDLSSPAVPKAFSGFRVLQLSDLHDARFGQDNARLLDAVEREKPDIILLTGDFIEDGAEIAGQIPLYQRLAEIAPSYFVSGNHDWASGAIPALREALTGAGVTYLSNEWVVLEKDGQRLVLCGVEDPNGRADSPTPDKVIDALREEYPDDFVILAGHRNYWPEKYPRLDVDLIFCGHGHGGVIRLPLLGGLVGPGGELLPRWDAGLFDCGRYQMVLSRGLGDAPILPRFLNNPQIVVGILK